jgi:hypothetical protein
VWDVRLVPVVQVVQQRLCPLVERNRCPEATRGQHHQPPRGKRDGETGAEPGWHDLTRHREAVGVDGLLAREVVIPRERHPSGYGWQHQRDRPRDVGVVDDRKRQIKAGPVRDPRCGGPQTRNASARRHECLAPSRIRAREHRPGVYHGRSARAEAGYPSCPPSEFQNPHRFRLSAPYCPPTCIASS